MTLWFKAGGKRLRALSLTMLEGRCSVGRNTPELMLLLDDVHCCGASATGKVWQPSGGTWLHGGLGSSLNSGSALSSRRRRLDHGIVDL